MTVLKLEIPEGERVPLDQGRMHTVLSSLLVARSVDIETLGPGAYDVTPKIWKSNTHNHELTVFDNGEGLYRIFPKTEADGYQMASEGNLTPFSRGGKSLPLDAEIPIHVVGGGHHAKVGLHIFGILMYVNPDETLSPYL